MDKTKKAELNGVGSKKTSRNVETNEFFLIFGIISIILFFILIYTVRGPHIVSYYEEERDERSGSSTMFMLPIWIIFIYLGSGALFIGFLIKFLSMIWYPNQHLGVLLYAGLILTITNLFLLVYNKIHWFTAIYIEILHILGPIVLVLALLTSISYLLLYWLNNYNLPYKVP